ncbi:MAG: 16S rRNA (guanine(527)-N(7))-methyltransferase RsmG [Pseudomonadota bacterium]
MGDPGAGLNVSRETLERLTKYHDLISKWSPRINLVSKSSLKELWPRHIWDSYQLIDIAPKVEKWADFGSGGGFPALVIAICALEMAPNLHVTMVESDQRKTAFLRTVIRDLHLNASVHAERVEALAPLHAEVISARALADLSDLLSYSAQHLTKDGTAFFLKGEKWEKEVKDARESWSFTLRTHRSKTSPRAAILEIKDIECV